MVQAYFIILKRHYTIIHDYDDAKVILRIAWKVVNYEQTPTCDGYLIVIYTACYQIHQTNNIWLFLQY